MGGKSWKLANNHLVLKSARGTDWDWSDSKPSAPSAAAHHTEKATGQKIASSTETRVMGAGDKTDNWQNDWSPAGGFPTVGGSKKEAKICRGEDCREVHPESDFEQKHVVKPSYVMSLADPLPFRMVPSGGDSQTSVCVGVECDLSLKSVKFRAMQKEFLEKQKHYHMQQSWIANVEHLLKKYKEQVKKMKEKMQAENAELQKMKAGMDKIKAKAMSGQLKAKKKRLAGQVLDQMREKIATIKQLDGHAGVITSKLVQKQKEKASIKWELAMLKQRLAQLKN